MGGRCGCIDVADDLDRGRAAHQLESRAAARSDAADDQPQPVSPRALD